MNKYSVVYEIMVEPTSVIIELLCKDKEHAQLIYDERLSNFNCKGLRIIEKPSKAIDKDESV